MGEAPEEEEPKKEVMASRGTRGRPRGLKSTSTGLAKYVKDMAREMKEQAEAATLIAQQLSNANESTSTWPSIGQAQTTFADFKKIGPPKFRGPSILTRQRND
ncbi:hypothetical protein PIB30_016429 [Stylosanthes scabra]|uniref:Uncharacterized protein n=1 Tax=Stylosanthes scabra TaxID=79078 RepID=A0ABU6W8G5_9FABA|nr:hypothetical protein [Stylosanthes scabra]